MKILTMGSPATTDIFKQKINDTYNGEHEIAAVKEFYTIGHLISQYERIQKDLQNVKINDKYREFLKWNFEKGGFWGKINKFQPDVVVLDLFSDIYFGNFELPSGNLITRNFRLDKIKPDSFILKTFNDEFFYSDLISQINKLCQLIKQVTADTHIIINGFRFPNKMSIDGYAQDEYDKNLYKIDQRRIGKYNSILDKVDRLLEDQGFYTTKFSFKYNFAEKNSKQGDHWYYYYNQNYYTDMQTQIEEICEKWGLGPSVLRLSFQDRVPEHIKENVVLLDIPNKGTNLKVFRWSDKGRESALKIAAQDYVLHGNIGHSYRFIKRKLLKGIYPKYKDIHYSIIPPKESYDYWDNRLIVRMLGFSDHYNTSVFGRNFRRDFRSLKDSITKNTFILEIGDINLIAGSFYSNTNNFSDYEQQIGELIKRVTQKYNIPKSKVVMYGTSRGATGALLNGANNNYKIVVADPVIDDTAWLNMNDSHFVNGVRKVDLTEQVSEAIEGYKLSSNEAYILGTSNVGVTFAAHLRLPLNKITLLDMRMKIYEHAVINSKSVPIQLAVINYLLAKEDVIRVNSYEELDNGVVFEVKDLMSNSIPLDNIDKFRIRVDDIFLNKDKFSRQYIEKFGFTLQDKNETFEYWYRIS